MTEKVKLPREVANALDDFRGTYAGYEWMIMKSIIQGPDEKVSHSEVVIKEFAKKSNVNFVKIMQALVNGYEVEQTPEDKVKEYYRKLNADHLEWTKKMVSNSSPAGHELTGCVRTLNILGIKIEGVNA